MVAALASQLSADSALNCVDCAKPLAGNAGGVIARHVCPSCGVPQPLNTVEDYFTAFGLNRGFALDRKSLEKTFFEISRALHPDRFASRGADAKTRSLERMSFLNEAYRTLKSPELLRDYLLELEGIEKPASKGGKSATIPMELAESWFELQDSLTEDPERARHMLAGFEAELNRLKDAETMKIVGLEKSYDESKSRPSLTEIGKLVQSLSYLKSMERDVGRIKERFGK